MLITVTITVIIIIKDRLTARQICKINDDIDKDDDDQYDGDDDDDDDDDDACNHDGRVKSVADLESAHITSWLHQILAPKHYFSSESVLSFSNKTLAILATTKPLFLVRVCFMILKSNVGHKKPLCACVG